MDNRKTLEQKFTEACNEIPKSFFSNDITSMFENVIDWCRDYFNEPKDPLLAYAIIGCQVTEILTKCGPDKKAKLLFLQSEIEKALKAQFFAEINSSLSRLGKFPINIEKVLKEMNGNSILSALYVPTTIFDHYEMVPGQVTEINQNYFGCSDEEFLVEEKRLYDEQNNTTLSAIADMSNELVKLVYAGNIRLEKKTRTPYIGNVIENGKWTKLYGPEETYFEAILNN